MKSIDTCDPTIPLTLSFNTNSLQVKALLDTGALASNRVSKEIEARIRNELHVEPKGVTTRVYTAFDESRLSLEMFNVDVTFHEDQHVINNELLLRNISFNF